MKAIKIMMVVAIAAAASMSSAATECNQRNNAGMLDKTAVAHKAAPKTTAPEAAAKSTNGKR